MKHRGKREIGQMFFCDIQMNNLHKIISVSKSIITLIVVRFPKCIFILYHLIGQNFRLQLKILSILSDDFLSDEFLSNFCIDVIHFLHCLDKNKERHNRNSHLLKYQRDNSCQDICEKTYGQSLLTN